MSSAALTKMPAALLGACREQANRHYPREAGGVFMGHCPDSGTVVITHVIGPGPGAVHGHHEFEPDQEWQTAEIARHYERSGRRETYLGDWHSHPDAATGSLSNIDRRILRRIINTPGARAPRPLMGILHGAPGAWQFTLWRAQLQPRRFLWPALVVESTALKVL